MRLQASKATTAVDRVHEATRIRIKTRPIHTVQPRRRTWCVALRSSNCLLAHTCTHLRCRVLDFVVEIVLELAEQCKPHSDASAHT